MRTIALFALALAVAGCTEAGNDRRDQDDDDAGGGGPGGGGVGGSGAVGGAGLGGHGGAGGGGAALPIPCIADPAPSESGQYDVTFANGVKPIPAGYVTTHLVGLRTDAAGRIVAFGDAGLDVFVARYTAAGDVDPSFGGSGAIGVSAGPNDVPTDAAIDGQGRIYVVGSTEEGGGARSSFVLRVTTGGVLDTSFAAQGRLLFTAGGPDSRAMAVLPVADGVLVAGVGYATTGGSPTGAYLRKYDSAGVLDPAYPSLEEPDTAFTALAHGGDGVLFLAGDGTVRKLDAATNLPLAGWTEQSIWQVERIAAHPDGGVSAVTNSEPDFADGSGSSPPSYPAYVSYLDEEATAAYCDGRVLFAGDDGYGPGVIRGTPGSGFDLGSPSGPASWPAFDTLAAGTWSMRAAEVQLDGKVIAGAEDGDGEILLVRFAP